MEPTIKQKLQDRIAGLAAKHPLKFAGGLTALGFLTGVVL